MSGRAGLLGAEPWILLALVLLWAAALLRLRGRLGEELRGLGTSTALSWLVASLLAAFLSSWFLDVGTRFEPVGHEASYWDVARSLQPAGTLAGGWEPYVTYPLLRYLYRAVAAVFGPDLGTLLGLNLCARAAAVPVVGLLAWSLVRRRSAAHAAAWLFALHPTAVHWGATIYNVTIPLLGVLLCWWLGAASRRIGEPAATASLLTATLVVATRVEWGIAVPMGAVVLLALPGLQGPRGILRVWAPGLLLSGSAVGLLFGLGGTLSSQGGFHDIGGYLETAARQGWVVDLLPPLDGLAGWLTVIAGGVFAARRGEGRVAMGLLGAAMLGHGALATFNDLAPRHGLPAGALLLLTSSLLTAQPRAWPLLFVLLASNFVGLIDLRGRYFLTEDAWVSRDPRFQSPALSVSQVEGRDCYLITDNEKIWRSGQAGSHFNLMEPDEAISHWNEHHGCVLWLYDVGNHRADGLDVAPRATKLRRWFDWRFLGPTTLSEGTPVLVFQMTQAPWGRTGVPLAP